MRDHDSNRFRRPASCEVGRGSIGHCTDYWLTHDPAPTLDYIDLESVLGGHFSGWVFRRRKLPDLATN